MVSSLLNSLLYFPSRTIVQTPAHAGLSHRDVAFQSDDGETLHGWWVDHRGSPVGHVLLCHGNAGNVGDRVMHASLLTAAGFDVLLFDYRGYGRSSGRVSERGTYRDARAALRCLGSQPKVDASRIVYVGESLGGAVALELALGRPPAGLVLISTFTSVRDMARVHYRFIPRAVVPDAYPSLQRIGELRAPVLLVHGEDDEIVPVSQCRTLFEAATGPKRIRILPGVGHNDLFAHASVEIVDEIALWAKPHAPRG